jgi:hypothetical protein
MTRRLLVASVAAIAPLAAACPTREASRPMPALSASSASTTAIASASDETTRACASWCGRASLCGDDKCAHRCDDARARWKPSFVLAMTSCARDRLGDRCDEGRAKSATDGDSIAAGCASIALSSTPRDAVAQRKVADAVCARARGCWQLDREFEKSCIDAALKPHDNDEAAGAKIVDAASPASIASFRACVRDAPCPPAYEEDHADDECWTRVMGSGR